MAVEFFAKFETSDDGEQLYLVRTLNDGSQDREEVDKAKIEKIEEDCRHLDWRTSGELGRKIGSILFEIIDSERKILSAALNESQNAEQRLQLNIIANGATRQWPFELLYHEGFLVPFKIDLVRLVDDGDAKDTIQPRERALKMLFMACSPAGLEPVLSFEEEEDALYKITEGLPIHIDVEDSGSLEGLEKRLEEGYDVIHLSGHADIDLQDGSPFFWMESDIGEPVKVTADELAKAILKRPPTLLFLSGCRTGQAPDNKAAYSFSRLMVLKGIPAVLGWGLPVSDTGATIAAQKFYYQLSSGNDILSSLHATRRFLFLDKQKDWPLLRLESNSKNLHIPLVKEGQTEIPNIRNIQHESLEGSYVNILKKGFVGRRRQIQDSLKTLKKDTDKIGLLIHGTGGLGKSCLAGKICERLPNHKLIIVHGILNSLTLLEAIKKSFEKNNDDEGLKILEQKLELPDKLKMLCNLIFKKNNYLFLLDDFEQNLPKVKQGDLSLESLAEKTLKALLLALPDSQKNAQLIITSRYTFTLPHLDTDMVQQWLHPISPESFRNADLKKKIRSLRNIHNLHTDIKEKLSVAGRGNPRLLDQIDALIDESPKNKIEQLLKSVSQKKEEFVEDLILEPIISSQSEDFNQFLCHAAVFFAPVPNEALEQVCRHIPQWLSHKKKAARLSLMEEIQIADKEQEFWITPMLRQELFNQLTQETQLQCHQSAVQHYLPLINDPENYNPHLSLQLIEHALKANMPDEAVLAGGPLLKFLRISLAYSEAIYYSTEINSIISESKITSEYSFFWNEYGLLLEEMGQLPDAINFFSNALSIDTQIYGEQHERVATHLNNLGLVYRSRGEIKKAIEFFNRALEIDMKVCKGPHPDLATTLNNLAKTHQDLGEVKKAIELFERALEINRNIYGEHHPNVAGVLNNLASAYQSIGDSRKAIELTDKAFSIVRNVYGDQHPNVAFKLNNLGEIYQSLGEVKMAIKYYMRALAICQEMFGEVHPSIAPILNNLGSAYQDLGDTKRGLEFLNWALKIDRALNGESNPGAATTISNLGSAYQSLGEFKKAIEFFAKALEIDSEIYGEQHPIVAEDFNKLGSAYKSMGDINRAIGLFERALEINMNACGEQHPNIAGVLNNLGSAYQSLGKFEKAIKLYERALHISRNIFGEHHPNVAGVLNNLGSVYQSSGKVKEAIEFLNLALKIDRKVFGEKHPRISIRLNNLGSAYQTLGEINIAIELFYSALEIDTTVYGERHAIVANRLNNLGGAYLAFGQVEKASEFFEKALDIDRNFYGELHPDVAIDLNNLGDAYESMGDSEKAFKLYETAYRIWLEFFGPEHPYTQTFERNLAKVRQKL